MKLLGYFIKNLSKYRYLLVSEEFQLFLRGPTDFHKSGIMGRPVSYYQISQKYNKVFEQYAFYTRTPETEKEISDVTEFFNHGKGLIEKFEAQCKLSQQVFKQIDDGTNKIMGNIKDLTRFYGEKIIEVRQRDKIEDPYEELLAWTRNTLLEIQGVLEGIGRRADLERSKSLTLQKIEEEKKNILKRQSGKKKIIQYFNKKSSEFYISQSENEIKNLEQSTTSLDCILNFSSAMMLKDEMPDFKNRKIFTLGVVVDISCERSQKELEGIIEQLKELEAKI